ncbi:MAG TPA: ABC transporter permease [Candidatus Acidoferrum sp.]|nr:ABC transporter permease [Candidatus Acidoferrum sp.]
MQILLQDIRYGLRMLARNPGFTAVAVLAIALGIGVNAGIFSVLNGAALRMVPVPGAERVVSVDQIFHGDVTRNTHGEETLFSWSEYQDYRANNHVFSGLLAYEPFLSATLAGGRARQLYGQMTSCNYFDVLDVHPAEGRGFVESDCAAPGAGAVAVLSNELWQTTFGAEASLIGKRVILNRTAFTVIGIAPLGFGGTEPIPSSFWVPITMQAALEPDRDFLGDANVSWLALLGRVKPGVSVGQVKADLGVIAARIDQQHPGRATSLAIRTASFLGRPEEHNFVMGAAAVILVGFGLVLLIACANVANLMLARATARQKEIAVRLSVGASRWRLIRQLLSESVLLALMGGALGSVLAFWSFQSISSFVIAHLPPGVPPLAFNLTPDARVLGYALILTLITGVVFGLAPALQASRADLNTALKGVDGGIGGHASGGLLRHSLVAAQVAVCMILLIAAGLLLRGLYFAQTVDPGFAMNGITVVSLDLHAQGYKQEPAAAFEQRMKRKVTALPGVDDVVEVGQTPLSDNHNATDFSIPGKTDEYIVEDNAISHGYFSMLGIPIVRGRDFTEAEVQSGAHVAIVTETTARKFWPGEDPIGKILREGDKTDLQIVGVAKDAEVSHLGQTARLYIYLPAGPKVQSGLRFMIHGGGGFAAVAAGVRDAASGLDPDVVVDVTRLEDNLELWRTPSRIVAGLAGSMGTLALLLASIGIYGVVSYAVSRRTREIGIRMTLGADGRDVMSMMLRQSMRPVLIGGAIGIVACAGVSWVLSSMLFGISPRDPIAFLFVPAFLLGIALLASYVPARRATKVNPVVALRYE